MKGRIDEKWSRALVGSSPLLRDDFPVSSVRERADNLPNACGCHQSRILNLGVQRTKGRSGDFHRRTGGPFPLCCV